MISRTRPAPEASARAGGDLPARPGAWRALLVALVAAAWPVLATAEPRFATSGPFAASRVTALARDLAKEPFVSPAGSIPAALAKLEYDQYRDIRFNTAATIWAQPGRQFRLQLLPLGYLFTTPIEVATVEGGQAKHLAYRADLFTAGPLVPAPLPVDDVGFSGFRLLYPINDLQKFDEVLVVQGASYFRSLGRNQAYGLSARGLALKTGDPTGEEFPIFRAFWIEEPQPGAQMLVWHALLDGPSATGAYRFELRPGQDTELKVDVMLFPRVDLKDVGLAPETSMFMFSPNGRALADDFRPQVHDSDGLLIHNGRGEHLWRPLANPSRLQLSVFADQGTKGFGLLQRERSPAAYQDFEAFPERRPSLWVEPVGDWGEGDVILTEIPSEGEIHDNIVAAWHPRAHLPAGSEYHFTYRLSWGGEPAVAHDRLQVVATASGRAEVKAPTPVRRFVVDYSHGAQACPQPCPVPHATVTSSAGQVRNVVVSDNPITQGYRVAFTLDPEKAELCELRLDLKFDDRRVAEVWVYGWTRR
jgi:glucans biosynthesis protein